MKHFRINEYGILFYRLILVYIFYGIARMLFIFFNENAIGAISFEQLITFFYRGLLFDTTAILYINLLFIVLSILPLKINTQPLFQKIVFYVYFTLNSVAYATNFIDMAYYPFSKSRLTSASLAVVENEKNIGTFLVTFFIEYWYIFLLFGVSIWLWILLYKKLTISTSKITNNTKYFSTSIIVFFLIGIIVLAGLRGGDLSTSTRPINILDANRYVTLSAHADAILNTPFCLIRTIGKNKGFRKYNFVSENYIQQHLKPIKQYEKEISKKPNIVIFILESFGREYWGSMNTQRNIPDFQSYTPFLDSLSQHGAVFDNAFANGWQSIHGMSSILAGIPTFHIAYTSSPYAKQPVQSIVSICNEMGYDTSFFHSAPNGSMGFLGFSNILGYDHYYGKTEYNNDADFDGIWGIWDEPFFQFMNQTISKKTEPFMSTIFTVSSHHPFKIPKKYEGKFKEGKIEIHKCIRYSDYALKQFFNSAKKEKWYQNTIFVFVSDHTNMSYYPIYKQPITGMGVPILFFSPNENLVPKQLSNQIAQQIDIYPSLVHLMGYKKPFRSWGRSLFSDKETPKAYVSNGHFFQLMQGNYIYVLNEDGSPKGVYAKEDEGLKNNLLHKEKNTEVQKGIKDLQAMIQDYMNKVMNKKLTFPQK